MFNTLTIWLVAIIILLYAYVYVWSRGPQDGRLWRMIRRLRKTERYWRKRALRDEAILSRVIDKKSLVLGVFLCLFLIPIVNPDMSSMPAAIVDEAQETPFLTAADGDESEYSIPLFAETVDDNRMLYPDCEEGDATNVYDFAVGDGFDYSDTYQTIDCSETGNGVWFEWWGLGYGAGTEQTDGDFLRVTAGADTDGTAIGLYCDEAPAFWDFVHIDIENVSGTWWFEYYNATSLDWETVLSASSDTGEISIDLTEDYSNSANVQYVLVVSHGGYITLDWLIITDVLYAESESSTVYTESFAGVGDWTPDGTYAANITTDGDVATITEDGGGNYGYVVYTFATAQDFENKYLESRITEVGQSDAARIFLFYAGGTAFAEGWHNAIGTYKTLITGTGTDAVTSMKIQVGYNSGTEYAKYDYVRIGNSTSMGWQHDGSTTAGVTDSGGGSVSSDGDELTLTADSDGSTFEFVIDTTATAAYLDADYYPIIGLDFNDADSADYIKVESYDGAAWATFIANTTIGTDTLRANCRAADADIEKFRISVNPSANPRLKWFKAFSIANFTLVPNPHITNVVYVDSETGELVISTNSDQGTVKFDYDPALSVVMATHNVWNITSSTGLDLTDGVDCSFKPMEGGQYPTYNDATRGGWTYTGTLTDIALWFRTTQTWRISAIKFIEDGTAPDIIDKFIGPPEPDDSEAVTITAVTYDAVEVYEVTINAVVYPTGFSDVDYDMTEQTDDVLWSYEFSNLTAGYYLFQVTANDGANTYSEYIPVTVRVSIIEITTYTFFGASSDFSYMQYSGHISHDCTYNISEWSTTWSKNETHTGSVTEGMFNIAWDKITVDDAEANFTIVFVSGSLSLTIEGYYGTAYKLLRITEIEVLNMEESLALTNITINFYTNKDVDWYVYDRDDDDAVLSSGSSVEGSDDLYFLKNRIPYAHYYAVKWTDGVTDIWYNSSYWTYRQNVDSINPPGTDWGAKDERKTIEFWVTIGAFIGIGGFIVLGVMHYGLREQLKALQLPRYRTQERDR